MRTIDLMYIQRNSWQIMAGLLFILSGFSAHAANNDLTNMGRLFFNAQERQALDRLRLSDGGQVAFSSSTPLQQMTLDGFVKRSSGKSTTWVNQQPHFGNEASTGIKVLQQLGRSSSVSLLLPSGERSHLKVGQTLDVNSGKISEVYDQSRPVNSAAGEK